MGFPEVGVAGDVVKRTRSLADLVSMQMGSARFGGTRVGNLAFASRWVEEGRYPPLWGAVV